DPADPPGGPGVPGRDVGDHQPDPAARVRPGRGAAGRGRPARALEGGDVRGRADPGRPDRPVGPGPGDERGVVRGLRRAGARPRRRHRRGVPQLLPTLRLPPRYTNRQSALIAIGVYFRDPNTWQPGWGTVGCELAGMFCMSVGGWLGGTLVYRNQIGVDHRYAGAGKWKEEDRTGAAGESVDVAAADELKVGQMKLLHVNGRRIVLARTEAGHVAFDDHCTHR